MSVLSWRVQLTPVFRRLRYPGECWRVLDGMCAIQARAGDAEVIYLGYKATAAACDEHVRTVRRVLARVLADGVLELVEDHSNGGRAAGSRKGAAHGYKLGPKVREIAHLNETLKGAQCCASSKVRSAAHPATTAPDGASVANGSTHDEYERDTSDGFLSRALSSSQRGDKTAQSPGELLRELSATSGNGHLKGPDESALTVLAGRRRRSTQ